LLEKATTVYYATESSAAEQVLIRSLW